jgi:hypothetical protein
VTDTNSQDTPSPKTKRCSHCGAMNPAGADWCALCFERFQTTSPESPLHEASPPPTPDLLPPALFPPNPERKEWTIGRVISRVLAVVAILSGLLAVGFFLLLSLAVSSFGSNK